MKGKGLYVLLAVLVVQLFLTMLVFIPAPHNGGDNAGYVSLAHSLLDQGAYRELWDPLEPPHTKYPPVFPLLLAGAMALGVKGWVGLKAIPFLSTLLAGLFTFLWVRGRAGLTLAAAVALLLALSDGVLYYSHWILSDPTFLALTIGALWALERAGKPREEIEPSSRSWLSLGFALVILAYFTRSAGLPLVVATLAWLGLGRRWKALASFMVAFLLPAGLWWLRGRLRGGSEYGSEFWFIDPYRPELGRVGVTGLLGRVWENLLDYVTNLIPEGIVGGDGWFLLPLGLALVLLALVGWGRRLGRKPDVAEFFFPLYAGLILLWPGVWSGDRFALPLLPLLLFYAGAALLWILKGLRPTLQALALGVVFLLLALPALKNWGGEVQASQNCRTIARAGDPWACYGLNIREYVLMAQWSGENLPPGATVVTRKPRIFFVLSGVKTLSLPLTTDAGEFLATTQAKGAQYLTVDRWDGLAGYYLPPILGERPGSFCYITGVEVDGAVGIQLLGITPDGGVGGGEVASLRRCPEQLIREEPLERGTVPAGAIPLLVWGPS
jgi:hypothetical protein